MHPAPSVIVFSVLSGAGFGLLFYLGFGFAHPYGSMAFLWWGLGYGLAVIGLLASTFHLGNPKRAWRAFTQWRTSWLSREAWASVAALLLLAPMALSDWLGLGLPRPFGWLGGALALLTVFTTSMIYAQIKAVPRWHHWLTPVMFLSLCAGWGRGSGGAEFCCSVAGGFGLGVTGDMASGRWPVCASGADLGHRDGSGSDRRGDGV